jgi:hypothetical protein
MAPRPQKPMEGLLDIFSCGCVEKYFIVFNFDGGEQGCRGLLGRFFIFFVSIDSISMVE